MDTTLHSPFSRLRGLVCAGAILASPAHLQASADGEALYDEHCAACHQVNGGGIGLPLSPSKLATVSDDYIKLTIRNGRSGRIMPAFDELADREIDAITAYIRSWSGVPGTEYSNTPVHGDRQRGKRLFQIHCAQCHAADGSGSGLGTGVTYSRDRAFEVMPPAITNPGFLASAPDQMIKRVIMLGRPGTEMQSYLDKGLVERDIDDLVSYIRGFEQPDPAAAPAFAGTETAAATLIVDSPYDFETTVNNVKAAIAGRNFRYFPDRYLEHGMASDADIDRRQLTIRFCNFNRLYELIRIEPRLGAVLPCRITVSQGDDGTVRLIAMNLPLIAKFFNNSQLADRTREFHDLQVAIIEEATL